ncbi:MAG: YcaO-like family protein [Desulfobacterales bacterium]|nr:YcaO-like family protein [Desulfobacterales bacterium]
MKAVEPALDYELRLVATDAATGYFGAAPRSEPGDAAALAYIRAHPNDEFMRRHLLRLIQGWDDQRLREAVAAAEKEDPFLLAVLWEAALFRACSRSWVLPLAADLLPGLSARTPLVYIRSHLLEDRPVHERWAALFRLNILEHRPLPGPGDRDLPAPCGANLPALPEPRLSLKDLFERSSPDPDRSDAGEMRPAEVHALALTRLRQAGVVVGAEMRHTASLSPIGLLRTWRMQAAVRLGRHDYALSGELSAYGRGLDLEAARAACAMEIVERCSAFGSFDARGTVGYRKGHRLAHGRLSELRKDGLELLDPNELALEAPYRDEPLYWVDAQERTAEGIRPVLVPAQCVFLFCNLDEIKLFSALGSTGLGAGVSPEGARLSALTEVVERDCEGTTPFDPALCFEIETSDERLDALLKRYRDDGIHLQFQDLTPAYGLPCCKCFVVHRDGRIAKGTGAHLNARRALVSALTETPYPFPGGPASQPAMEGLTRVPVEALPNYSSGAAAQDLQLVEKLLLANGFRVIYADLTRKELGLPVVRAIVPGMEILADFDRFSRIHPRLYAAYRKFASKT